MSELREIVESLGHEDVATLLRSGNVIFRGRGPTERLGRDLEQAIEARLKLDVRVVIRTGDELAAIVEANPMPEAAGDGSGLHVMFLEKPIGADERARLEEADFRPDQVRPSGGEIYVWYRHGVTGSRTAAKLAQLMTTTATDRNWNTVTKLAQLTRN